jgi:hypothetical protein
MRYPGEAEESELMGIGYLGEIRLGADGHLYQWTEEADGLGNVFGGWKRLRKIGRRIKKGIQRVARRVIPVAQMVASAIPHPKAKAVAAGLRTATPLLKRAGLADYGGLGALYEAPDGSLYAVDGVGQEDEYLGLGDDELMEVAGIGSLGEVRLGLDGHLYQWTEESDGLGNVFGSWKRVKKLARRARQGARRVIKRALPVAQQVASAIPHPAARAAAARIRQVTPALRRAGVAGHNGLGNLYQAPDGAVYEMEGIGDLAEDEELYGFAQDEEFEGVGEDEDLYGLAEDEELYGLAEDEAIDDLEGYIREDGVNGLEAYVPEEPPTTRMFVRPGQAPDIWRPLW